MMRMARWHAQLAAQMETCFLRPVSPGISLFSAGQTPVGQCSDLEAEWRGFISITWLDLDTAPRGDGGKRKLRVRSEDKLSSENQYMLARAKVSNLSINLRRRMLQVFKFSSSRSHCLKSGFCDFETHNCD